MTATFSPVSDLDDRSTWPEVVGEWPRLTGRQTPEFESRHEGDESEGDSCAEFGRRVGLRCMPWEWSIVRAIHSTVPNDFGEPIWTHRDVVLECTRQQGKTLILVLVILWRLFRRGDRIVYTAQRWATAEDVFDRVVAVIMRVPALRKRLAAKPTKKDNRGVIRVKGGAKAEFGPRSQDFGRGYTEVDLLIHDEAYDLDARETGNLEGAQRAAPNPQTIMVSTPPVIDMHPKCHRLANMHRLGHARAPHLFYAIHAAPRHMSRDDPEAYPLAQPSYGVVGNDREMAATRQKAKTTAELEIFDADYMGWGKYPPPESDVDSEIPADGWEAMGPVPDRPRPKLIGRMAVALERSPDRKLWTIEAAQRTNDGRVHIEVGYSEIASDAEFVTAVATVVTECDPVVVGIRQGTGAAEVKDALAKLGIEPEMINQTDAAAWCGGFLDAALDGRLSHSGQSELDDGVAHAVKRDLPRGGFIWELVDEASYAQLMGASLAHGLLVKFSTPAKRKPVAPRTAAKRTVRKKRQRSEFDVMSSAF